MASAVRVDGGFSTVHGTRRCVVLCMRAARMSGTVGLGDGACCVRSAEHRRSCRPMIWDCFRVLFLPARN